MLNLWYKLDRRFSGDINVSQWIPSIKVIIVLSLKVMKVAGDILIPVS